MSFDPYRLLGVEQEATAEEIRRAYRTLARRYHPDVNRDRGAEEIFKDLAQAFAVLSSAERRALYDEFGEASLRAEFDPHEARRQRQPAGDGPTGGAQRAASDCAAGAWAAGDPGARDREASGAAGGDTWTGGGARRATPEEGRTPEQPTGEGRSGRPEPTGSAPGPLNPSDVLAPLEIDLATSLLGGETRFRSPLGGATLTVRLDAALPPGTRLRLPGRGRPGVRGGPPGDLYLELIIRRHPFFRREANDLFLDLPLTLDEALRGCRVSIPTLDGWMSIPIPARRRGGELLCLRGKGLPPGAERRGDLYVHLCLRLPDRLGSDDRSVERLAHLYSTDVRAGLKL